MASCLRHNQLIALAGDSVTGREAKRLTRHCEHCPACRSLLEELKANNVYAGDIRQAVRSGHSSLSSSDVDIARSSASSSSRSVVPLMSADGIGGYEILGEIHRGGQGVVYRAIQKSTGREVAIKVAFEEIRIEGRRPHRFDREVELASRLNHPNIIVIFDSGATPDGRCYFVMDYVHGLPVDQYVRECGLELSKALELFICICDAVNHAHQRGVIHRDLKPSNILVDDSGTPHVLDFGLAKALGSPGGFSSVVSVAGQVLGTVPYMAPEQLAGRPQAADIRTDVYALGVLLYEMLAGSLPFDIDLCASDMLRCITDGSPVPPSRKWNPVRGIDGQGKTRHGISPVDDELDAVALKAMASTPERRYQSAADLARDVRHYLAAEPIEAKRESGLYVFRKLLHRYRLLVSIASVFFVLLATALTLITALYFKVAEQRHLAQKERDRALTAQESADNRADQLRSVMYLGRMSSAMAAAESGNYQRTREELSVCPADLRGWEWYSLASLFDHEQRSLEGHQARVMALSTVLGPDHMASGSADGTVRFWDLERRQENQSPLEFGKCQDICFSPDGQRFAVKGLDNLVTICSFGQDRAVRAEHRGAIQRICFSPDSRLLAIGDSDGSVYLCDVDSGRQLQRIGSHQACVSAMAFSPDGELLATGSYDKTVRIWSIRSGGMLLNFGVPDECIASLVWSPDGTKVVSGGCTGSLIIWDIGSGKIDKTLQARSDQISALVCFPDGRMVVSADMARSIYFWDLRTGRSCGKMVVEGAWIRCLAFSIDGQVLAAGGNDGFVRFWDMKRIPYTIGFHAHDGGARAIAFGSDTRIASSGDDGKVRLWELPSARLLHTFTGHEGRVRSVACGPDGSWIVSGGADRTLRIWDTRTGQQRLVLHGHEDGVLSVSVSPNGRLIASGGSDFLTHGKDNSVRIWDSSSGAEMMCLRGHTAGVPAVAFSPDGLLVASGGRDNTALVWDLASGRILTAFKGHRATIRTLVFSPDGGTIFSASEDDTVQAWDPRSGKLLSAPLLHSKTLLGVAVSPDGMRRATCGNWCEIHLWPSHDVNWDLLKIHSASPTVWSLAFSPDGTSLASSEENGDIWISRTISALDIARSPAAAIDLAAGAVRLWRLRQRNDAELLFKETLKMHQDLFGANDPRTLGLSREFASFQKGEFADSPPQASPTTSPAPQRSQLPGLKQGAEGDRSGFSPVEGSPKSIATQEAGK